MLSIDVHSPLTCGADCMNVGQLCSLQLASSFAGTLCECCSCFPTLMPGIPCETQRSMTGTSGIKKSLLLDTRRKERRGLSIGWSSRESDARKPWRPVGCHVLCLENELMAVWVDAVLTCPRRAEAKRLVCSKTRRDCVISPLKVQSFQLFLLLEILNICC